MWQGLDPVRPYKDLATVAILVVLPALAQGGGNPAQAVLMALLKTGLFAAAMLVLGSRALPWVLTRIAKTRSRELFILAVMAAELGTTMMAAELFGISLALGAFLAGVVIGESEVSHQAAAEALPFQEIFAVVFFVSVGMLVNPATLMTNGVEVLLLTLLVVVGKGVTTVLLGLLLPARPRTMLVVSAGLSQIGEFSFIVGQTGVSLGLISAEQYGLVLAAALITIVVNPFLFRLVAPGERFLKSFPGLWKALTRRVPEEQSPAVPGMEGHVVVIGAGRVGSFMIFACSSASPSLCFSSSKTARPPNLLQRRGAPVLYGDASNSELLTHASLLHARSLVVTVPSQSAAELIVGTAHQLAPSLPVVARASTVAGINRLAHNGARDVTHPELEGGLEIVRHTLLALDYSVEQVQRYTDAVRRETYYSGLLQGEESLLLSQLLTNVGRLGLTWITVSPESQLAAKTLSEIALRSPTGVSVVAVVRGKEEISNPGPEYHLADGDLLGLIGDPEQLAAAEAFLQAQDGPKE